MGDVDLYVGCVLFGGCINGLNIARRLDVSSPGFFNGVIVGFITGTIFLGLPLAGVFWLIRTI